MPIRTPQILLLSKEHKKEGVHERRRIQNGKKKKEDLQMLEQKKRKFINLYSCRARSTRKVMHMKYMGKS